ncbi:MAG: PepSY-associated TM helix domain-containing protein [Vicinamibacterales bacterium]
MRKTLVVLHRYAGLVMAAFIVVVAITGSLLAFRVEIERLVAPQLFAPDRVGIPLDAATLIERTQSIDPRVQVSGVDLKDEGRAQLMFSPKVDPATGKRFALDFTQIFVNPYTGTELARRRFGDLSQGMVNAMPFIRQLHGELVLPRSQGGPVLGWIAVLWTIDCFVALYLTFPRWHTQRRSAAGPGWFARWGPAWLVQWQRSAFRVNFDLHRAGGLWTWLLMLMFAWSSVYLNLHWVYAPITGAVLNYPLHDNNMMGGPPLLPKPLTNPALNWHQAQDHATAELVKAGLTLVRVESLSYSPGSGVYTYRVATNKDFQTTGGRTYVMLRGDTGALERIRMPSGQYSGLTFTNWLYALHMGNVFGLVYRVLVFIAGLVLTMLAVTGVYLWWKKRGFRRHIVKQTVRTRTETAGLVSAPAALTTQRGN